MATKQAILFSAGSDTGGTLIRSHRAFAWAYRKNLTDWQARAMVTSTNYIGYAEDLPYSPAAFYEYYRRTDVVVLNSILYGYNVFDNGMGKPIVLMHHGLHKNHFRQSLEEVIEEATEIGAIQGGTTVNLELLGPISWVPSPIDAEKLKKLRWDRYQPASNGNIRIMHCPTNRAIKGTADIITAVNILRMEGLPVELEIIENAPNVEVLEAKAARCDIYVDQLELGYGINAIEAMAMHIPVVAGFTGHPDWEAHAVKRYGVSSAYSDLPFVNATPETLVELLRMLVLHSETRSAYGSIGWSHVQYWHSPGQHVRMMAELLEKALAQGGTVPSTTRTNVDSLEFKFKSKRREQRIADILSRR